MFWLAFIPFEQRLLPIFLTNDTRTGSETGSGNGFVTGFNQIVNVPDFDVNEIYLGAFSPDSIAVQAKLSRSRSYKHNSAYNFTICCAGI